MCYVISAFQGTQIFWKQVHLPTPILAGTPRGGLSWFVLLLATTLIITLLGHLIHQEVADHVLLSSNHGLPSAHQA